MILNVKVSFQCTFKGAVVEPYQRFVNTTPKPSATKKSSGELVGPEFVFWLLLLLLLAGEEVAAMIEVVREADEGIVEDMIAVGERRSDVYDSICFRAEAITRGWGV
jgi:hypothetical protein